MGKFLDKIRQAFNLFLIMLLIAAVAAVFVYFLTDEAQRGTTFWMSVAFMGAGLVLTTLFASRVSMRGDSGRSVPVGVLASPSPVLPIPFLPMTTSVTKSTLPSTVSRALAALPCTSYTSSS